MFTSSPLYRYMSYLFTVFRELQTESNIQGVISNRKRFLSAYNDMHNERVGFKDMDSIALLRGSKILEAEHAKRCLEVSSVMKCEHPSDTEPASDKTPCVSSGVLPTEPSEKSTKARRQLKEHYTAILLKWINGHKSHPFPTKEEKVELCRQASITERQLNNWFTNYRRRHLK
ncbi:Homeobox protein pknox1 [Podila verticillata]|nr:Homeobox protein pknox1 [Podila verticillata]